MPFPFLTHSSFLFFPVPPAHPLPSAAHPALHPCLADGVPHVIRGRRRPPPAAALLPRVPPGVHRPLAVVAGHMPAPPREPREARSGAGAGVVAGGGGGHRAGAAAQRAAWMPRSHLTGHSVFAAAVAAAVEGDHERFTLRLPDHVREQMLRSRGLCHATSLLDLSELSSEGSSRGGRCVAGAAGGGFGNGNGGSRHGGRRWQSFLARTVSWACGGGSVWRVWDGSTRRGRDDGESIRKGAASLLLAGHGLRCASPHRGSGRIRGRGMDSRCWRWWRRRVQRPGRWSGCWSGASTWWWWPRLWLAAPTPSRGAPASCLGAGAAKASPTAAPAPASSPRVAETRARVTTGQGRAAPKELGGAAVASARRRSRDVAPARGEEAARAQRARPGHGERSPVPELLSTPAME